MPDPVPLPKPFQDMLTIIDFRQAGPIIRFPSFLHERTSFITSAQNALS